MINSMTAFARVQSQGRWGSAICELRSVNHRYLEMRVHVPDLLFELEQPMLEYMREHLKRGKVECYFKFQPSEIDDAPLQLNMHLAEKLVVANQKITQLFQHTVTLNPMDVLRHPGVIQASDVCMDGVKEEILKLLEAAVSELIAARNREGGELKNLFLTRLDSITVELAKAKARLPTIIANQRERLIKHFQEAQVEMDNQRLAQEMVMFTQKIDVTEEIERIETHVTEVRRVLKQGGAIGRRLDFLMQELNREANTLGAKSVDVDTTHASLEMKVLIEQLREQMQNIE